MDHGTFHLIIGIICGFVGGILAGAALKEKSLGFIGNSIVGIIGGIAGFFIMKALGVLGAAAISAHAGATPFDLGHLLTNIGGSGAAGAIFTAVVSLLKEGIQEK